MGPDHFAVDVQIEPRLAIFFTEFNCNQPWSSLLDSLEDCPSSPNVSLSPLIVDWVIEPESFDCTVKHFDPAGIVEVIPVFLSVFEKDLEWLFILDQEKSNTVSSALFVP